VCVHKFRLRKLGLIILRRARFCVSRSVLAHSVWHIRFGTFGLAHSGFAWGDSISRGILRVGDFEGANLKCYDSNGGAKIVNYRNKIVKMDGRLPHEVVDMADFKGERFTIIAYKTYDHRKLTADPILETPEIVWNGM
jgi:hypothetical protein